MDINYDIVNWAINEAKILGVDAVHAELLHFDNLNIQTEGVSIASLQQNKSQALLLSLYIDDRFGTFSTNNLSKEAIQQLLKTGVASTRLLSPDPDRTLPDPSRYYKAVSTEACIKEALALQNYVEDPTANASKPTDVALAFAKQLEGRDSRIVNTSVSIGGRSGWQYMADSQGFEGFSFGTSLYAYSNICLMDSDGSRPSDGWIDYGYTLNDLNQLSTKHCQLALEAAQNRIGAHPCKSGLYTIAVEPTCIMKLIEPVIDAMYGGSLYQHRSFVEGKLGEQLFSPSFTLTEEPHRLGAYGATLFGSDGVATRKYDLIREGKICTWLIGTYYARKMHCDPTDTSTSVLCLGTGTRTRNEILNNEPEVLLITGFLGGNSNEATGDFSYGIEGQLYRYGERIQGISGMNLTGNFLELWKHLSETASDAEKLPDGYLPLTLFKDIKLTK